MTDISSHPVYRVGYQEHIETLTESQRAFPYLLDQWIQHPKTTKVIVAGGPGSGKTYTVISCLDHVMIPQLRMAPTARIASAIKGYTIHSKMRLNWKEGSVLHDMQKELETETDIEICLQKSKKILDAFHNTDAPDIVVIDEVGMVAFWLIEWVFEYFIRQGRPILCIGMGDPNQLKPVGSLHSVFSAKVETERIDLKESKRFEPDYESIILTLRSYVDENDETGLFTFICGYFPVVELIDSDMLKQCTRALAYMKETVDAYNDFYLKHLIKGPRIRLWKDWENLKPDDFIDVKAECDIFVTRNGMSSVSNGTPLIFKQYNSKDDVLKCETKTGKLVKVRRNIFTGEFPIVVGFAGTIHKFQGDTIDDKKIVINFNGRRDLNLVYTALSRVRSINQIVALQL